MAKQGVLVVNLGTPPALSKKSVRQYLREFLSDPRVIDLPAVVRYILLYGVILPFRPQKTLAAYQAIWQAEGSPLMVGTKQLCDKLQAQLGADVDVVMAMRYASHSIASGLSRLQHCKAITVLPLFPQYASATTGSVLEQVYTILAQKNYVMPIRVVPEYYDNPAFITPSAAIVKQFLASNPVDHVLFSFHGLPVRHIQQSGCGVVGSGCTICPPVSRVNQRCYRAQCFATARAIAAQSDLVDADYTVSFQSRLGKTPWIEPYTDQVLEVLYAKGVRRLAITCPSFVVDCLETLEEIGLQLKSAWKELGGEAFMLIPCVNDHDAWVQGCVDLLANADRCDAEKSA